jgi:hypothetical protein
MAQPAKTAKPDLREYEEEAIPFDDVIRRLASKPAQKAMKPKPRAKRGKK